MKAGQNIAVALTLCILMISTGMRQVDVSASRDVWDGMVDTSWYDSTKNRFTILTAAELAGLSAIVNGTAAGITQDDFSGKTITLVSDIDLGERLWTPIGYNEGMVITATNQFKGTFDGNKCAVYHLNINLSSDSQYGTLGLFGTIGGGARIQNLGINTVSICLSQYNTFIGSLVGLIGGNATIEDCYAKDITVSTSGTAYSAVVGGLVGRVQAVSAAFNVTNCYTSGIENMTGNWRGGIVGLVHTDTSSANFNNCYTTYTSFGNGANSTAVNCYYATDTCGDTGIVNTTYPQFCANGVTSEVLRGYAATIGNAYTEDIYDLNNGYPILTWQVPQGGGELGTLSSTLYMNYGKPNQIAISENGYMNGQITGVISGINNFETKKDVYGILAVYDETTLVDIKVKALTLPELLQNASIIVGPISIDGTKNYKLKMFLWEQSTLKPLLNNIKSYTRTKYDVFNEAGNEWIPVPLVTQEQKSMGISGGEGGQWLLSVVCDPIDAHLLFAGVDVGTILILRSTDGGATWQHSARGLLSQGANAFAIDPHNINRVLAIGCGTSPQTVHGIYLSTDKGFSWKQVLSEKIAGHRDVRDQIAFDPSSYDEKIGGSAVAYWSRAWEWDAGESVDVPIVHGEDEIKGLFKSVDGGETWTLINEDMTDGYVKVHPTNGTVYIANHKGFHKSTDGGKTFRTILPGVIQGLDVIPTHPDNVYINDSLGVLVSTDCGETFERIENTGYPVKTDLSDIRNIVRGLKVSPANPNNMLVTNASFLNYKNKRYYSNDGGQTWSECAYDDSKDFFKANNRQQVFAWHPTDENKVWSLGGDWIVSSSDAGKTFMWDNDGNTGVYIDERSCFNIYNPDLFYFGSQDFHGAVTYDYGETWKHIWKFSNEWAGFVYGGYAVDASTFIACVAEGWDDPRYLYVTRDGGETWDNTGLKLSRGSKKWAEMCMQSPNNPDVLFAGEYRSDDRGATWTVMGNCYVACAYNPYGRKELYGIYKDKVVVSYNEGKTWQEYVTVKKLNDDPAAGEIWDIAYDGINNILYYVSGTGGSGKLLCAVDKNKVTTDLTANLVAQPHNGVKSFQLVTIDPRYPDIVYVGGYANANVNETGVQRSCDGGKTFQVLSTVNQDISIVKTGPDGGKEPRDLIVHPLTGELWCANGCIGWTKIAPPYKN